MASMAIVKNKPVPNSDSVPYSLNAKREVVLGKEDKVSATFMQVSKLLL